MGDYIQLSSDELKVKISKLIDLWDCFFNDIKTLYVDKSTSENTDFLSNGNIENLYNVNLFALREVFERTHQRTDYFDRYHERLKMSDFKEIGLIAFWISKFKPFSLKPNLFNEAFAMRINEEFALYFIFNSIANYSSLQGQKYKLSRINSELYNELLYTMQYRDLSKEAYGCVVELIYLAMITD